MLYGQEKKELRKQEAKYKISLAFVKHLKSLLMESGSENKSIQLITSKLYKNFEYPEIIDTDWYQRSIQKKNHTGADQAHKYSLEEGMINIDTSVKPHKYSIADNYDDAIYLRPYQKFIINQVKNENGSILIEAPTGSGKSVIASNIAKDETNKGGKVLIVAPKIILLEQLAETFKELTPSIIHGSKDYDNKHNVFISTIQTAHKRDLGFEPSMILIDEVHFGFDGKMIKQLLKDFGGRLIGLSATPYDKQGKVLQGFDTHINDFDLEYMIENNYLHNPKCYSPLEVDLSGISIVAGDYNQTQLNEKFNKSEDVYQIVNATKDFLLDRKASLVFCINISHAKAIAEVYNEAGIPTKAIHSKLSQTEQKQIMNDFKTGKIKLLANPMILTTGFDYPATDTIILARPTQSQNLFRQMVGRGLRLSKNKCDAVLLDCASVISNLGLPTEKIKEVKDTITNKVCKICESDKLYTVVRDKKTIQICAECGDEKVFEKKGYKCEACSYINSTDVTFYTKDKNLYITCSNCGEEILVSKSTTKQELKEIFDEAYIEKLQKKVFLEYIHYFMDIKSAEFLVSKTVVEHLKALQKLTLINPELFVNINSDKFKNKQIIYEDEEYEWRYKDSWMPYDKDDSSWRVFDKLLEDQIIFREQEKILLSIDSSEDAIETLRYVQKLYKATDKKQIPENLISSIRVDIKNSKLQNINELCNKRIKSIVKDGEDIERMIDFVKTMESVFL